jgi:hypothetical protein
MPTSYIAAPIWLAVSGDLRQTTRAAHHVLGDDDRTRDGEDGAILVLAVLICRCIERVRRMVGG